MHDSVDELCQRPFLLHCLALMHASVLLHVHPLLLLWSCRLRRCCAGQTCSTLRTWACSLFFITVMAAVLQAALPQHATTCIALPGLALPDLTTNEWQRCMLLGC